MATYTNPKDETLEASAIIRQDVFRIQGSDGEPLAEAIVEFRHNALWVSSVWVKNTARGYRLASEVLRAVGLAYTDQPLYLHVQAYDGRPKTDAELVQLYAQFGYKPTAVAGILCRDYSGLKAAA